MARTPRHSKPKKEALTIDLDQDDVKTVDEAKETDQKAKPAGASAKTGTAKPEPKTEKPKQAPKAAKSSSGGSAITGGLVGAVLAIIGAGGLQWAGLLPAPNADTDNNSIVLEEKIAALETSISTFEEKLADTSGFAMPDNTIALTSRIDELETLVQNDNTNALNALGEINIRMDQLTSQVTELEQRPVGTGGTATLPDNITDEISNLAALNQKQADEINALKNQIASLPSTSQSNSGEMREIIQELQDRLTSAEAALSKPNNDIPIARSLAAVNIKNAIDRGGNFSAELGALMQIDNENNLLGELQPIAEKGVLSRADLVSKFDKIANIIIQADKPVSEDDGIMTRLIGSATSMVKIRQVGDVEGESTEAIVARIETRLKSGNMKSALGEWQSLSDKAKTASQTFGDRLQTRIDAEALIDQILQAQPASAS